MLEKSKLKFDNIWVSIDKTQKGAVSKMKFPAQVQHTLKRMFQNVWEVVLNANIVHLQAIFF